MKRYAHLLVVVFLFALVAQAGPPRQDSPEVTQALAQGDAFLKQKNPLKALQAYQKADKESHHTSAACYLKMYAAHKQLGDMTSALDDAKHAAALAGQDKQVAADACMCRGVLLAGMATKPNDKKLKEAETDFRQAISLQPENAVAHFNLGMVLLREERDPDGIAELQTYISSPDATEKTMEEARRIIANPIRAREPFAPDFSFETEQGFAVSNAALHGTVVLLDFWGSWCPACRESTPMLVEIHKKYRDREVQLVGVSSDQDQREWMSYVAANHMDWPDYLDSTGEVLGTFKVDSFPTFIVLDRDGVVRFRQSGVGPESQSEIEDAINKALKKPASTPSTEMASATLKGSTVSSAPVPATAGPSRSVVIGEEESAEKATAPTTGIEMWSVSQSIYRNEALGLTYEFPKNLRPANPQVLHDENEQMAAALKAQVQTQKSASGMPGQIIVSRTIFYASANGQGDGMRYSIPCVRITAMPWPYPSLTVDALHAMGATGIPGLNPVGAIQYSTIGGHDTYRSDYEGGQANMHFRMARFQFVTDGHLVTIEMFATSQEQLDQMAATVQSLSFSKP